MGKSGTHNYPARNSPCLPAYTSSLFLLPPCRPRAALFFCASPQREEQDHADRDLADEHAKVLLADADRNNPGARLCLLPSSAAGTLYSSFHRRDLRASSTAHIAPTNAAKRSSAKRNTVTRNHAAGSSTFPPAPEEPSKEMQYVIPKVHFLPPACPPQRAYSARSCSFPSSRNRRIP